MKKDTSKDLWESMKKKYQGNERVKSAQLQRLQRSFEVLEMKRGEKIEENISRVTEITNNMRNLGEEMLDSKIVEKILQTLTAKFTYIVCAIEESNDVKDLTVDGLQSSLTVHELNLTKDKVEDKVLKVENLDWRPYGGRGREGYQGRKGSQGRGGFQGRGRGYVNRTTVECFKCHKMGHYKSGCKSWEKEATYAEMEEDLLLMAHIEEIASDEEKKIWFLDSRCSNHMCGTKEWFIELDGNFKHNVRLGDDRRMDVEGRENFDWKSMGELK